MFACLQAFGLLMGCAIRTRALMPLPLPSLLWKPLVGQAAGLSDLDAVAQSLVRGVSQPLRACASAVEFEELFGTGNLQWSVHCCFAHSDPCPPPPSCA